MLNRVQKVLPVVLFMVSVALVGFGYGLAVGIWHVFPYQIIEDARHTAAEIKVEHRIEKNLQNPSHVYRAIYTENGVRVNDAERSWPGVTLVAGSWKIGENWHLAIRLIDSGGGLVHEWVIDPSAIWPKSPHDDWGTGSRDEKHETYVHGAVLLPGGDVVFNLEYFGLVRLNADAEVVWKLPYRTHHSVTQDEDGSFWVCGMKWRTERIPRYLGLRTPLVEDFMVKVSPDGEVEREISILDALYQSKYYGLMFMKRGKAVDDVVHMNDVDVLSSDRAKQFPMFNAGDIMVSLRYINTVLVIDAVTEKVKWSLTHPFMGQHDPDFTADGFITVFDNHLDKDDRPSDIGGSRILKVDPRTKEVTVLYGEKEDQYFFTEGGGKHQHLPNGNILITGARSGRVFEITKDGDVVWDWVTSRWDENSVSEILEGSRYDLDILEPVSAD